MTDTLPKDRLEAICADAMKQAEKIYKSLIDKGIEPYKAELVLRVTKSWCRLVELGNLPQQSDEYVTFRNQVNTYRQKAFSHI